MTKQEELDLLLKELYLHRYDRKFYPMRKAGRDAGIAIGSGDVLVTMSLQLEKDHLIDLREDLTGRITLDGILFCEKTSYAYKGYPIITISNGTEERGRKR